MSDLKRSCPAVSLPSVALVSGTENSCVGAFKDGGQDGAAHQSCNLTVRSSKYMVFDKKSIPMVACTPARVIRSREAEGRASYTRELLLPRSVAIALARTRLVLCVELVINEARYDTRLANALVAQEHQLVLRERADRSARHLCNAPSPSRTARNKSKLRGQNE